MSDIQAIDIWEICPGDESNKENYALIAENLYNSRLCRLIDLYCGALFLPGDQPLGQPSDMPFIFDHNNQQTGQTKVYRFGVTNTLPGTQPFELSKEALPFNGSYSFDSIVTVYELTKLQY